jgi:threonine/homoserine/homoserine lactone efflux protein
VGTLFHVTAETLGLSALLASSALAFQAVKYAGAVYLIYLGVLTLRRSNSEFVGTANGETRLRHIFGQGVLVNLLNLKTALFFLAFLPQFSVLAAMRISLEWPPQETAAISIQRCAVIHIFVVDP